jgi:hypothetical protein
VPQTLDVIAQAVRAVGADGTAGTVVARITQRPWHSPCPVPRCRLACRLAVERLAVVLRDLSASQHRRQALALSSPPVPECKACVNRAMHTLPSALKPISERRLPWRTNTVLPPANLEEGTAAAVDSKFLVMRIAMTWERAVSAEPPSTEREWHVRRHYLGM